MNPTLKTNLGSPQPFGVSPSNDGQGLNFAIFSRHATGVKLVIETPADNESWHCCEIPLLKENRTGDVWHIQINGLPEHFTYGYRMEGPNEREKGHVFRPDRILLDPYSKMLVPRAWAEKSSFGDRPRCIYRQDTFDWQRVPSPKNELTETVIYELHVRGFTFGKGSDVESPGTFAAIIERIPYLQELGITAVELMPVNAFDETDVPFNDPLGNRPLLNFWGYNPLSFFALHPSYAANPDNILVEFKTMVRELHRVGIEVYLDMVINHTGEGNYDGTTSSFRGIDNTIFYLLDKDGDYLNYSGCGNTVNCNHPVVRAMIYDVLHYWAGEMRVDGFRFDLASIFSRGQRGEVLVEAPLVDRLAEDALLRDVKLIAEAWDASGLYQVGSFSSNWRWGEWNGKFRDDVRTFMSGREGTVSNLATRIAGSSDLYQNSGKSPVNSINFITSHDGFSLYDLVSYNEKHNEANGENNRDGDNNNLSWNSGEEGPVKNAAVNVLRLRRMKSFMLILFLSQGVPMLSAGDEMARTQHGNNNAWCQDSPLSWIDWTMLQKNIDLTRFVQCAIALRQRYKVFGRSVFFTEEGQQSSIQWQYLNPGQVDWSDHCHGLAFLLESKESSEPAMFFVMLNGAGQELEFTLPKPPAVQEWYLLLNSCATAPQKCMEMTEQNRITHKEFVIPPFGAALLQAKIKDVLKA